MAFLHASGSGYFPFCIYEGAGDIGDGTYYPVGMTLEDAMTLYWKAKSFRIVETWNTIQSGTDTTVTGSTNTILTPDGGLDTMSQMACRPLIEASGQSGTFSITLPQATNPGPYSFQDYITIYLFQEVGVVYRNGLYYPQISFFRLGGYYSYIEWFNAFTPIYGGFPATITINGNQYSFTVYANVSGTNFNNTTTNITIASERLSN
jgi:hypothetical protein